MRGLRGSRRGARARRWAGTCLPVPETRFYGTFPVKRVGRSRGVPDVNKTRVPSIRLFSEFTKTLDTSPRSSLVDSSPTHSQENPQGVLRAGPYTSGANARAWLQSETAESKRPCVCSIKARLCSMGTDDGATCARADTNQRDVNLFFPSHKLSLSKRANAKSSRVRVSSKKHREREKRRLSLWRLEPPARGGDGLLELAAIAQRLRPTRAICVKVRCQLRDVFQKTSFWKDTSPFPDASKKSSWLLRPLFSGKSHSSKDANVSTHSQNVDETPKSRSRLWRRR